MSVAEAEESAYAQEHIWHRPSAKEEGRATPRPAGVFWAHTGGRAGPGLPGGWLCEEAAHEVYVRRVRRPKRGAPGEWVAQWVYACAVCWPPRGGKA